MSDTLNKRLNVADVFTLPYEANKSWGVESASFTSYDVFFDIGLFPTASNKNQYTHENLVYKSVLANYYPEFYPTSSHSTSSYFQTNNLNSTLLTSSYSKGILRLGNNATTEKFFPTVTGSFIYTINIPKSMYGEQIKPKTFVMDVEGGWIYDDGEYNLRWSGSGNYLAQSQSSLIRLNSIVPFPTPITQITIGGTIYPILSRDNDYQIHLSTPLYLDSSSYTINYTTSSFFTGSDLTAYEEIQTVFTTNGTLNATVTVNVDSSSFDYEIGMPGFSPILPLSESFDGPPNTTVVTFPGNGQFSDPTGSARNFAFLASITGSSMIPSGAPPVFTGSIQLAPGWALITPVNPGASLVLTRTSASYGPTTVISQSSITFPANIVSKSGSIEIGGTNYPIIGYRDGTHVEINTPVQYTTNTPFTASYSSSALFDSGTLSAGGMITVLDPNMSSSLGTILSQSSYVGNIFYEQGLGVLTSIPTSIIP